MKHKVILIVFKVLFDAFKSFIVGAYLNSNFRKNQKLLFHGTKYIVCIRTKKQSGQNKTSPNVVKKCYADSEG